MRRRELASVNLQTDIPGPNSRALAERRKEAVVDAHGSVVPIYAASAEGATITDVDGNVFLDFAGGIGALNTGHRHSVILDRVRHQIDDYLHVCFTVTPYEPYVALAERLNRITPGDFPKKTLLVNSGAEAVENAVKVARYVTRRPRVISFEHSFHGRSLMTMALTYKEMPYKHGFGPFPEDVLRLPFPYKRDSSEGALFIRSLHALLDEAGADTVAAVVIELVAGEGGFMPANREFVAELRKVCTNEGIVLVVDEVQSGFGRTGKMFACEWYDLEPDIITMAKSLSGGLPLAAVTGRAEMMDAVHAGGLGGTFGGNSLACQSALGAIEILEKLRGDGRLDHLSGSIPHKFQALQERSPFVSDARGIGCMYSLEICDGTPAENPSKERANKLLDRCLQAGLIMILAGTDGNVIRTLMPLTISDGELKEGIEILEENILVLES
ncbi:MAG: aminotransferase class III-fold pyridoxal phosphate-dependent enzyme [Candidatus Marinimicrobia bacterium]|nr:aminotransferase class III-fold pyridoxal phosphate-dependent enzyme [Candidatus Neomarinimicrobiota bacterium]